MLPWLSTCHGRSVDVLGLRGRPRPDSCPFWHIELDRAAALSASSHLFRFHSDSPRIRSRQADSRLAAPVPVMPVAAPPHTPPRRAAPAAPRARIPPSRQGRDAGPAAEVCKAGFARRFSSVRISHAEQSKICERRKALCLSKWGLGCWWTVHGSWQRDRSRGQQVDAQSAPGLEPGPGADASGPRDPRRTHARTTLRHDRFPRPAVQKVRPPVPNLGPPVPTQCQK